MWLSMHTQRAVMKMAVSPLTDGKVNLDEHLFKGCQNRMVTKRQGGRAGCHISRESPLLRLFSWFCQKLPTNDKSGCLCGPLKGQPCPWDSHCLIQKENWPVLTVRKSNLGSITQNTFHYLKKCRFIYFMCKRALPACVSAYHMDAWCLWKPGEHARSPGTGYFEYTLQWSQSPWELHLPSRGPGFTSGMDLILQCRFHVTNDAIALLMTGVSMGSNQRWIFIDPDD